MSSQDRERALPQTLGFRIGTASFVGIITVFLFWLISTLFVLSAEIQIKNTAVSILLSLFLTAFLPGLLYKSFLPMLRDWINTTLEPTGAGIPGENDRVLVFLSSILSLIGIFLYVFTPSLLSAKSSHVISAVLNNSYSLMEKLQVIYVDLITVCGFGLFVGFGIIAWYRTMYPRFCQNCNKSTIVREQCSSCGIEVVNRPSHTENILNLLKDDGIREYVTESKNSKEEKKD